MSAGWLAVGGIEVQLIRDGVDRIPPELILEGATPGELEDGVGRHADGDGQLVVAYNAMLVRSGAWHVLVDAGFGELAEAEGAGGGLATALLALGVGPSTIDHVVISHAHADHVGGLVRAVGGERVPVFERAAHWFLDEEWSFWTSAGSLASMPADFADPARACLPPLAAVGLVELASGEREIVPGVRIVPAQGHTPGHATVVIESGHETAIWAGDAVFHPLSFELPDLGCAFDTDSPAAARSRRDVLDRAANDGSLLFAPHLDSGGRVERHGRSYRFVPD